MQIKGTMKNHFISKRLASQKKVISIADRNKVNTDSIKSNSIQKVI